MTTKEAERELSPTMRACLKRTKETGGRILRRPGGYWFCGEDASWWGTTTVEALAKRGLLEYSEFKLSKNGDLFPVEARLKP